MCDLGVEPMFPTPCFGDRLDLLWIGCVVLSVVCGVRLGKDFYVLVIGVYFVVFLEFWFVIVEIGIYIYIYIYCWFCRFGL